MMKKETRLWEKQSEREHIYIFSDDEIQEALRDKLSGMGEVLPEGKAHIYSGEFGYMKPFDGESVDVRYKINEKVKITIEPIREGKGEA